MSLSHSMIFTRKLPGRVCVHRRPRAFLAKSQALFEPHISRLDTA